MPATSHRDVVPRSRGTDYQPVSSTFRDVDVAAGAWLILLPPQVSNTRNGHKSQIEPRRVLMKKLALLVACAALTSTAAFADKSTAPGQNKVCLLEFKSAG